MNYTLHQLQVFLTISQTLSITKAAEVLHLTQPAVSIQLKNLQQQFDIPLTEVVGRRIHLTDFGREIAVAAGKILDEAYAINYKTLAYQGLLHGKLKLAVVSTGKYVMPYFLAGFIRQHPGIDLEMDVTNRQKVLASLEANDVDFALVSILPQQVPVRHIVLMTNRLYLVGPGRPATQTRPYTPEEVASLPLIYRESGSGTRMVMETYMRDNQLTVPKKLELTSNEAVKQALIAGLGYSIMPLIGLKHELLGGDLNILPARGLPLETSWNLVWHKDKQLSPVAQAYVTYVTASKEAISQEQFGWCSQYDA